MFFYYFYYWQLKGSSMKTVHQHPQFHLPVQVLLRFFSVQQTTHQHLENRSLKKKKKTFGES
jgi:hypothetical protein